FFSSRRRHTRCLSDWSSDVCSSDLAVAYFRRPESVLVVVHTPKLDCLLLERADPRGFWQSVTGTLGWSETPAECAAREIDEETRSEERRVGKECRRRWAQDAAKKKD